MKVVPDTYKILVNKYIFEVILNKDQYGKLQKLKLFASSKKKSVKLTFLF